MKFLLKPLSVAVGVMILTACTTTKSPNVTPVAPTKQLQSQHSEPKEVLQEALKSQLRTSFGYRTDIYVSNQIRREALANATPEQLSAQDDISELCNHEHDKAYVTLLKTVKADESDIDNDKYSEQKAKIKKDFLTCQENFVTEGDIFALGADDSLSPDELVKKLPDMLAQNQKISQHDGNYTALDAKKAELVNEYLIKPSHVSMVGNYEPLKGVISALPSISYHAKNVRLYINQPTYVDLNAGGVYLWADNFALANSQALDKTLGDKWKDKWLFLPINDGSLPETFTKDFIKAVKDAQKERFLALSAKDFGKGVVTLPFLDNLPKDKQILMTNTPTVISIQNGTKNKAYADYVFNDTLYNNIVSAYPELVAEENFTQEYEMAEGESVIHVKNVEKEIQSEEIKPTFNSRFLMTVLLSKLRERADGYQDSLMVQEDLENDSVSKYTPVTQYGIERGKITWLHQRWYVNDTLQTGQLSQKTYDEPLFVDSFTQITAPQANAFGRLPTHLQKPTADNTVNLFDYKDTLYEAMQKSDDKYLKILSGLLFGQGEEAKAEVGEP